MNYDAPLTVQRVFSLLCYPLKGHHSLLSPPSVFPKTKKFDQKLKKEGEIKNIQRLIEIKREEEANKNETPNEAAASAELVV